MYERSKKGEDRSITESDDEEVSYLTEILFKVRSLHPLFILYQAHQQEIASVDGKISREDFITNVPENPDLLKILQKF